LIGEREITGELHSPAVNERVSPVSRISGVRRVLVELQKAMGKEGGVVMAGRDICTVVLPDAELKIFLTASEEERTRRRFTELQGLGMPQPVKAVREVIRSRDAIDSSREDSPLCVAPDAVVIDTTGRPVDEIVRRIAGLARTLMEE
jgi:cytidylate kinase